MPNAAFNYPGAVSGGSVPVVTCPDLLNFIRVLGFRLTAGGTNTAEWDFAPISGVWTYLQGIYESINSASALAVTYPNFVMKGDLLTAYTVSYGSGNTCTVADSQTNTWTQVGTTVVYNGVLYNGQMWQTTAGKTGQNIVTMTPANLLTAGAQPQALALVEMLAPAGTPSADSSNENTGTGATMSTGSVTVSGSAELLCGFFNDYDLYSRGYAAGAGFTVGLQASDATFGTILFVFNPNKSSSGAVTVAVTGGTPKWGAVGASFTNTGLSTVDGPYQLNTTSSVCVPQNDEQPVFDLPPGTNLVLTTTAEETVSGGVTYSIRQNAAGGPYN